MTSAADTDTDVDNGTEPEVDTSSTPDPTPPPSRLPTILLGAAVALLVAAATVAVWFGMSWFRAANDDGLEYSRTREEVDRVARAAIQTMNTLDYRKLDQGLADWSDATTGALHDEITKLTEENKQQLREAKSVTSAQVRSSAVRELDDRSGRAVVIAAVKITVSTGGGEPVDKYQRIEASLVRDGDAGWKLDGIGKVPYAQPGQ
jgi:Mce-associated membrane protein